MNNTFTLQELFNNRIFRVPDFQRGYAWEKQQVGEFLEDLEILSSARHHYTGTIVLHADDAKKQDSEGTTYTETNIVDGQQRLTTIVLLLNEISRELKAFESSRALAAGIKKNYVEGTSIDGIPLYKLSLNKDTDTFFRSGVLPESNGVAAPSTASAQRLLDAKKLLSEYLRKADRAPARQENWLRKLLNKVTSRLYFNLYQVEHVSEVGVIFEVMNDRGKPLTNLEKVKNYLLYVAATLDVQQQDTKDHLTDSVNDAWSYILELLMESGLSSPADEDQLLRSHWIMRYDPQSRNWDGSKSVKNRFDLRKYQDDPSQMLKDIHEYIDGLRSACICYCDARRPTRDGAFKAFTSKRNDIKSWNSKLVRVGITATFLPLLMAVRMRWPSEPEKYLEIIKLCEAFAFRVYRLNGSRSNAGQAALFRLGYDVAHEKVDFGGAVSRLKGELAYRCGYKTYEYQMGTEDQQWSEVYGWTGLRYFLYEYETSLALDKGGSPKVSWQELRERNRKDTIEHILPQSIENQDYWQKRFDSDVHQEYIHDIGNLTLTKGNQYLGNKSFPKKKRDGKYCYEDSLLLEEQEIAKNWNDWTSESITERRAKLLEWAKKRWHVDFGNGDGAMYEVDMDDDVEDEESEE